MAQQETIAKEESVAPGTQCPGVIIFLFKAALHKTFGSSAGRVTNADREIFPTVAGMLRIFQSA